VSTARERVLDESCGDSGSYLKNAHRDNRGVDMLIVAGRLVVAPDGRQTYLASCVGVVEQARSAAGCLDFMISADLVDPARINIFERWEWQAAVEAFRGGGPSDEQGAAIASASVAEYDVASTRQLA
jgi:quinol monooxygenase YgiN